MTVRGDYDPNCHQIFKGTVREPFKYEKNYSCKIEKTIKKGKFMKTGNIQVFTRVWNCKEGDSAKTEFPDCYQRII